MNRHRQFIELVTLGLLKTNAVATTSLASLAAAQQIPEEALPNNLFTAAIDWLRYDVGGVGAPGSASKPLWLVEYEENQENSVRVTWCGYSDDVDHMLWVSNAHTLIQGTSHPQAWHLFLERKTEVTEMSKVDAEAFLEWAQTIPGWADDDPTFILSYDRE